MPMTMLDLPEICFVDKPCNVLRLEGHDVIVRKLLPEVEQKGGQIGNLREQPRPPLDGACYHEARRIPSILGIEGSLRRIRFLENVLANRVSELREFTGL